LKEIAALGIDGRHQHRTGVLPEPDKIADWVKEAYTSTDKLMRRGDQA